MAGQLQQDKRGGSHVRPGPPARPRPGTSDGPPPAPAHRAGVGRHTGTRYRPSDRSGATRTAGLLLAGVAVAGAAVFWLQDQQEPSSSGRAAGTALTPAPDAGTTPSVAAGPGATADPSLDPGAGAAPGAQGSAAPGATLDPAVLGQGRTALVQAATGPARDAAALRAALEQVLSDRAAATVAMLRAVVAGEQSAAVPAATAVDATSADLEAVVGAWRDADAAAQLKAAIDSQTVAARAYATAVRTDDEAAADAARADMGASSRVLGQMLEQMTASGITRFVPPEDAARMRDLVDALSVGDTASAADLEAWLTARMGREGVALATGLAGPA